MQKEKKESKQEVILGIESSCDETSAALLINGKLKSHIIATQLLHSKYGGVVPELAARAHQEQIVHVVDAACKEAGLKIEDVTHIAVTKGPGLLGALLVGTSFANGLALSLGCPVVAIHHTQAHLWAHFIDSPTPSFPFLGVIVSGGHTQLVRVEGIHQMHLLGETVDDAIGEAFDKMANILGFSYPGGKHIDRLAPKGNPKAFRLPIAHLPGLHFSFSGAKTAFRYLVTKKMKEEKDFLTKHKADLCASAQYTLVRMIELKVQQALEQEGKMPVVVGGGVANNSGLRDQLKKLTEKFDVPLFFPHPIYCCDNAAMITMALHLTLREGQVASDFPVQATPKWPMEYRNEKNDHP